MQLYKLVQPIVVVTLMDTFANLCLFSDNGKAFCEWISTLAEVEGIPYIDIESVKESVLVLSEMENDEDPDEWEMAMVTLERVSSRLDMESPLKMMIKNFKLKYDITVKPNYMAVYV